MAHIRRHPKFKGSWQVRYADPSGREQVENFTTRSEAEGFLHKVRAEPVSSAFDGRRSVVSLQDWTDRWWKSVSHLKPTTTEAYESLLRLHILPRFGDVALGQIEPADVREWVAERHATGLSASRTRQAYNLLAQILQSAVESGYLAETPCVGVSLPTKERQEMRLLTAAEVRKVADATRDPYAVLVYVLAYGGLRWGEAAALRRERCDLLRSRLQVTETVAETRTGVRFDPIKPSQVREVVVPAFLRDLLTEHLAHNVGADPGALVFPATDGGPLLRKGFNSSVWAAALEAAGVDYLRPDDLRHTSASLLIESGGGAKAVQQHLGLPSLQATFDRYGDLFPSDHEALAERMDDLYRTSLKSTAKAGRKGG